MWRSRWRIASEPTIYIASELLSVIYLLTKPRNSSIG